MRNDFDNSGRAHFRPRPRASRGSAGAGREAGTGDAEADAGHPVARRNERRYLRVNDPTGAQPRDVSPGPRRGADHEEAPGYVIHLPVRVCTAASAVDLAYTVAAVLAALPEVDPGETTVSTVDDQNNRRHVFCDLPLPDRTRCSRPFAHPGACGGAEPGLRR